MKNSLKKIKLGKLTKKKSLKVYKTEIKQIVSQITIDKKFLFLFSLMLYNIKLLLSNHIFEPWKIFISFLDIITIFLNIFVG